MSERTTGWRTGVIVASVTLLVLLAFAGARAYLDERRLRTITAGMKVAEVEDLLGSPDYIERDQDILSAPIHSCSAETALVYHRRWRDSLFVHLDHREREVVCVERVSVVWFN